MEIDNSILMNGRKSSPHSPFAVFEHFKDWGIVRQRKVIPANCYFVVAVLQDKTKADIHPSLFIQGYRPHSSGQRIHVDQRRYAKFVEDEGMVVAKDDLVFDQVQLYQITGAREVELILSNGESRNVAAVNVLIDRICKERGFKKLSNVKKYRYHCPVSAGYFLGLRSYEVWVVLVGTNTGFSLEKKVLIIDFLTGIPAVVPYDDRHFEEIGESL